MTTARYFIGKSDGTGTSMTYDEVVRGVQLAINYRLGHSEGIDVPGRAIAAAAEAATHWLEASLTKIEEAR